MLELGEMPAAAHQDVPVSPKNDQLVCAGASIHCNPLPHRTRINVNGHLLDVGSMCGHSFG